MHGMHHCYRRGGSRLLWFAIGSIATTWFIKSRDASHRGGWGCTFQHRRELEAVHRSAADAAASAPAPFEPWALPGARPALLPAGPPPAAAAPAVAATAPAESGAARAWDDVQRERWADEQRARAAAAQRWEEEKDQLRQFTKQAEEKVCLLCRRVRSQR